MSYIVVENYNGGMDRRRIRIDQQPNSLYNLVNAHINRGGQIESRKAFVPTYDLTAGLTFGLAEKQGTLYVFGSADPLTVGLPAGVSYQRCQHPDGATAMTAVIDVDVFNGLLYVIAQFADSSVHHYYNGNRVTYWDNGVALSGTVSTSDIAATLASLINPDPNYIATVSSNVVTITAQIPGIAFSIGGSINGTGSGTFIIATPTANVSAVDEVLASGSFTIAGTTGTIFPTVNGVNATDAAVPFNTSLTQTALDIATAITASIADYTAIASGTTVFIYAAEGSGSTPNGFAVNAAVTGDMTIGSINNMAGGITEVEPVAQVSTVTVGGLWNVGDNYTLTLNGSVFGGNTTNYTALVLGEKIYVTTGSLLRFCAINNPLTGWDESVMLNVGAGFINISNHYSGSTALTGLQIYQNDLAVFSRSAIQVWSVTADPADNTKIHTLDNTGTRSPRAIKAYGAVDVFYLSDGGIRSLKARDASNAPITNDIGRPIDEVVIEQLATMTDVEIARAQSIIDPIDGRFWVVCKDKIFVLSYFPASGGGNITAFSIYEPGVNFSDILVVGNRIYARSGDIIYLYGGADNNDYGEEGDFEITVELPFYDASKPGDVKYINGLDITGEGKWTVSMKVDPKNLLNEIPIGELEDITLDPFENTLLAQCTTHFAPKFVSQGGRKTILGRIVVFFTKG